MRLKDIEGLITTEKIDGRFQEILSTQKIVDTKASKEYDGWVDIELLNLINSIDYENKILQGVVNELDKLELSIDIVLGKYFKKSEKNKILNEIKEYKQNMVM